MSRPEDRPPTEEELRAAYEAELKRLRVRLERTQQAEKTLHKQLADHQAELREKDRALSAKEDALREAEAEIDRLRARDPMGSQHPGEYITTPTDR